VVAAHLRDDRRVGLAQERPALGARAGARARRQRGGEALLDGGGDVGRGLHAQHGHAVLARLASDDVQEERVELRAAAGAPRGGEPRALELGRRDQPQRPRAIGDRGCREHRALGDDQRSGGQRREVVDDHRSALAVQRHGEQLVRRSAPALGGRQGLPALGRLAAGRDRAVAVRPRARVGAVEAQAVAPGQPSRRRRLAAGRRPTNPDDVPQRVAASTERCVSRAAS
jgi:hypothetical protein